MKLHDLKPAVGSKHVKKRVGRGMSSGTGKTSGKGHKGQNARSGGVRLGFEGGQMPLHRRVPKRGFTNIFSKKYAIVNVSSLEKFDEGSKIDVKFLKEKGLIKKALDGLKILGKGELTKKFEVSAVKFSKTAKEKIEQAGGKAKVI